MNSLAIVAYPQVLASSINLPAEILSAAHQMKRLRSRQRGVFKLHIATVSNQPVYSAAGLQIAPTCALEQLIDVDVVILPAIWRSPLAVIKASQLLLPLLRHWQERGSLLCAVGTATWLLAEAGLLDGKPATTHWSFLDEFAARYPQVKLQRKHLITGSGEVYCAGSVNSLADLTVHIVERFYGPQIARQIESQFSPEIRRSYRNHGYFDGEVNRHHDEHIIELQQWLHDHFAEEIDFAALAERLNISQRSMNRRFKSATDQTPGQFLQRLRLDAARELLRHSNLSIGELAAAVGYQDASYFCALFTREMGTSPSRYRLSVRGKLFAPQ